MFQKRCVFSALTVCLSLSTTTFAERTLTSEDYRNRLEGMWVGQMLGNYAGREVEGADMVYHEGGVTIPGKPITQYNVQWNTILQGQYYDINGNLQGVNKPWQGDDDTCLEFLYAYSLQNQSSLNVTERTELWDNNVTDNYLYIANLQAWYQINRYGKTADESGSVRYNTRAGWSIDSQITTETLGALSVGMRQQAADLVQAFGGITNTGYSLHAAQYYAAMYAEAPFVNNNVGTLVERGLEVVPEGSWTRTIVEKALDLYDKDTTKTNWEDSRDEIFKLTKGNGRYQGFVESASNTGLTTLALLYGQGSFINTVNYGVRGGEDSDCNPATAGGLIGMMKGQTAVLAELENVGGYTNINLPTIYRDSDTIEIKEGGVVKNDWTMSDLLDILQTAGEKQITDAGGIPDAGTGLDAVDPEAIVYPTGPRGLVGQILALGGTVDMTVKRDDVVIPNNTSKDRTNQDLLIDGIYDVTNNGVLPFHTYDGGAAPQTDEYEISFDREVYFEKLILHEGDILLKFNQDPNQFAPYGGYFKEGETLIVQVYKDGAWVDVTNLVLSEDLKDLEYYQSIELTFDGIEGQAIRFRGSAGGQWPFTSFTEIEVFGMVPEPATTLVLAAGATFAFLRRRRTSVR